MRGQQKMGAWIQSFGQLILFLMLVLCIVDLAGLATRGGLIIPLSGYLTGIFTGVFLQIVGAAIPNMRFANSDKKALK